MFRCLDVTASPGWVWVERIST
jgi:hypothetical protein